MAKQAIPLAELMSIVMQHYHITESVKDSIRKAKGDTTSEAGEDNIVDRNDTNRAALTITKLLIECVGKLEGILEARATEEVGNYTSVTDNMAFPSPCIWRRQKVEHSNTNLIIHNTGCGEEFSGLVSPDLGLEDGLFNFCPHCGKDIIEIDDT